MMKDIAWTVFFFATTVFTFRVVTDATLTLDSNPIGSGFLIVYFVFGALGAFWMMTDAQKHEKKLTTKLLLACIPFGFLYYYFYYVRPRPRPNRAPFNPYR